MVPPPNTLFFLSLVLLASVHLTLGWSIADITANRLIWSLIACLILLTALIFTAPSSLVRQFLTSPIRSDSRAFLSVIAMAFAAVIFITWIHHFIRLLVLFAAGSLVRLEFQEAEWGEWPAFFVFAIVSLGGFALGLFAHLWVMNS